MGRRFKEILIIDDDNITSYLNKKVLDKMEITEKVTSIDNGKDGLLYLLYANCQPEIIFLDLNMPNLDGFEFLEKYYKQSGCDKTSRIFILTTSTDERDIEKVKPYNVSGYINKPLTKTLITNLLKDIQ